MDALMAQLQEEHLRPWGANPIDRGYYPDRAESAPRGPFGGYFSEPSRVSEVGPSHLFMHPQRDRPDDFHYEAHRSDGVSDHLVSAHDGMPPRRKRDPNADLRHCRGIDLTFFDDDRKVEPAAIQHFRQGKKVPKIKPITGPLRGFAF